jgi:hypothetical protein
MNRITANIAFLLLFPGFFFYHTAIGTGAVPPLLGGYFSPVCLVLLPVLALIYVGNIRNGDRFLTAMDAVFWGFCGYMFFVVAVNFALGKDGAVVKYHLLSLFHYIVAFLVFRHADFTGSRFKWAALTSLAGMAVIIPVMSVDGMFYLKQLGEAADEDSVATYQGFARSYLVTFLVVAPFIRSLP